MTRQREIIKDIIVGSGEHLSADRIFFLARERMPSIAVGTVYRNLGLMVDAGEIRRISVPDAPDRFDKNCQPHEHLLCVRCGSMVDIALGDMAGYIEDKTGMKVVSYELAVRGVCPSCTEQRDSGDTPQTPAKAGY